MNKSNLIHRINKFYNTFAEVLGYKLTVDTYNLNDKDILFQIIYDINETLEGYNYDKTDSMCRWLNRLLTDVTHLRDKKPSSINMLVVAIILLAFVVGLSIGRNNTIRSAELLETTDTEYHISFGGEIHTYTFEEVR